MKILPAQFESMALEQLDTLYRVARRLSHNLARAEDLVQETYLRALKGREGFDLQEYGIRPWLLRILHNVHLTLGEREARQPRLSDDQQLTTANSMIVETELPIDSNTLDAMDERVVIALNRLPAEYRTVLLLWAVEDLSYKEIAAVLEVPMGTVMSRLYRARQKLGQVLLPFAQEHRLIRE